MEPVYCPNGHPNRPGTRICAICLALLEPSAPAAPPSKSAPRPTAPPPRPSVSPPPASPQPAPPRPVEPIAQPGPPPPAAPAPRRRVWPWLVGCLLLLALGVAAVFLLVLPLARLSTSTTSATLPTAAVTAEAVEPTAVEPTAAATLTTPPDTATSPAGETATDEPTIVATITPLATLVGVVITPTFAFGPDDNFIQNGDFDDDWVNGWTREGGEDSPGTVEVRPLTDAPDDSALHMAQSGAGVLHLAQRVVLAFPVESLVFRARVRLDGAAGGGRSALILRYEDADGAPLGASVWHDDSAAATALWGRGPLPDEDAPVVARALDDGWQAVELALGAELADALPDVDPVAVRQITISLALLGEDGCAPTACATTLEASQLSLTAEMP
ncbi:hypothetical protein [Candidatus Promineifilum breve]|uniref:hypothetical protein n=1 Tax=Candidatus Promineifilum breve TaxID=1806508 RepID=UPI0007C1E655|nr:hypothetical protein [Candidatus Promineifilum breve]